MSDKGTIEQLRAELVQAKARHGKWFGIAQEQAWRLATLDSELAQARAERAEARKVALSYLRLATKRKKELVQAQTEIARVDKLSDGYATGWATACAARDALADELADARRVALSYLRMATERKKELAQARAEPKGLQGANRRLAGLLEGTRRNRDYWYDKAAEAEAALAQARKEAQAQSDLVQRDWLSPAETEGLRRQLKHAEGERDYWVKAHDELEMKLDNAATGEAAIVEAAETLIRLSSAGGVQRGARINLREALEHRSEAAAKLLERLATLDAAEAALADCGLTGIYHDFGGLADAIEQMVGRLVQLEGGQALQNERKLRQEAELAAHIHDKACGESAQTVHTERARRRVAEREREAMSEMARDRGSRLRIAEQRAERAEALAGTLAEVHAMLNCSPEHPWHGCTAQTVCNEAHYHNHVRGARELLEKVLEGETPTNAQALAALVTPELANLLVLLASSADTSVRFHGCTATAEDTRAARTLAAQIREALEATE